MVAPPLADKGAPVFRQHRFDPGHIIIRHLGGTPGVISTFGEDGERDFIAARVQQPVLFEQLGNDHTQFLGQFLKVSAPVASPGT
jgi:hypothetical protein